MACVAPGRPTTGLRTRSCWPLVAWLLFALCPGVVWARGGAVAVVLSGPRCPDPALLSGVETELRTMGTTVLSSALASAAVARARAVRALGSARTLFTRADFSGCIALLSITEQELGRSLVDGDVERLQRGHRLLARVNLWLGICQWAAGDPQTALASFVRSAQLPFSPVPDPRLLPPEVVEAFRQAVAAPRQEVTCNVDPPLTPADLQVNGRGPVVMGSTIRVAAGTHYLVLRLPCGREGIDCGGDAPRGGQVLRSLRLEASPLRCRVQMLAPSPAASRMPCASPAEARQAAFAAAVTKEAGAGGTLLVEVNERRVALRLHRKGHEVFAHQLENVLGRGEDEKQVVARSVGLLISGPQRQEPPLPPPSPPWYTRWWVWALAGVVVAATVTSVALATQNDRVKVVFGP